MIISISGTPGSGKSTIAKGLAKMFGIERVYAGGEFRQLARKMNMTAEELNEYAKGREEIDRELDQAVSTKARELAKRDGSAIAEGRTMYHFIPESLKLYIKVDPKEAAKRIWKDLQDTQASQDRNEDSVESVEATQEKIEVRQTKEVARYKVVYKTDISDESNYDFVLDTTNITADEATQKVAEFIRSRKET